MSLSLQKTSKFAVFGDASAAGAAAETASAPTSGEAINGDVSTGYRTHSCSELRPSHVGETVTLCGWVQASRDMNHFAFVDLRDRYGITQCVFQNPGDANGAADSVANYKLAGSLGREFVVQITGKVVVRAGSVNKARATGEIEVDASAIVVLNAAKTPPFKIEDTTDALEDVRSNFRYLDIRRNPIKEALLLRNKVTRMVREHLNSLDFCEVETPVLIKSTPEGARDFVVPSRMNPGQFYALPQSPQTFKQILMVAGMDRYFQLVKCFRDEELRADRQPEFTQIDCEMSFVTQEDVLNTFEAMTCKIFNGVVGHDFQQPFRRMEYSEAMRDYGIDKPDLRFDMKLTDLTGVIQAQKGSESFPIFKDAGLIVCVCCPLLTLKDAKGKDVWTTKKIKSELGKKAMAEAGAKVMIWVKVESLTEKGVSSSANKYSSAELLEWCAAAKAQPGDVVCIFAGEAGKMADKTREMCGKWRHIMGTELGYRSKGFNALWVVNFPLMEWDEDANRWVAKHHPFTSSHPDDTHLLETDPGSARANAYDMVINGVEVGGGSIRIFDRVTQMKTFKLMGFSEEEAQKQFGFLLGAFEYGAPPHGGLAFGLDRLCTILGGQTSIRNYIAFPKNNMGRDMMIDSPSNITKEQLAELSLDTTLKPPKPPPAGAAAAAAEK